MSDNPYESPRTESAPPGLRERRAGWLKDRLALIATALLVFVFLMVFALVGERLVRWKEAIVTAVFWGIVGLALIALFALRQRRLR